MLNATIPQDYKKYNANKKMYINALQNKYYFLLSDGLRPICIPHPETIPDDNQKVLCVARFVTSFVN